MGFNKFGGGGGGKKGPRAHNGSFKNKAKLKPAPAAPFADATKPAARSSRGKRTYTHPEDVVVENDDDADDEGESGYREGLLGEVKPLAGATVSVTGCSDVKVALLEAVNELGGIGDSALTDKVTHLIADKSGTPKFDVRSSRTARVRVRLS